MNLENKNNFVPEESLDQILLKVKNLFSILRREIKLVFLVTFIGAIFGFLISYFQPILYNAKLVFVVEDGKSNSSNLGGLASLAGQFGVDLGASGGSGLLSSDNILLYFKSHSLAKEVLLSPIEKKSNITIAEKYSTVYGWRKKWDKNKRISTINFQSENISFNYSRLHDSLLNILIEEILINHFSVYKTDKKASFIEVNVKMKDEILAKKYCEKIVDAAVKRYVNVKTQRQQNTVVKLQQRVDSIANLLSKKTASGAAIQTSSSTMDINPLYRTSTSIATETTVRDKTMLATIFASVVQNLELAKFTLSQDTPAILIVDAPQIPLTELKRSIFSYTMTFSFVFLLLAIIFILAKNLFNSKQI